MNSATPPVPSGPSSRKKPSALASCILLGLLLGMVGAIGGGAYWAYQTFLAKPPAVAPAPAPPAAPTPASDPTLASNTKPRPSVLETISPASPNGNDPLATPVTPELTTGNTPPTPPIPPTPSTTPNADSTAVTPVTPTTDPPAESPVIPVPLTPDNPVTPLPEPGAEALATDPDPVVPAEPIQTLPADSPEVASLKADADRRIDEAPAELYSEADKERVRDAIRQAKRLTRVATLRFGSGAPALGSKEKARLKNALLTPEAEALLSDSQAVLFILGFADATTGSVETNRAISQRRAVGVGDLLKEYKVANKSYAVGIGATTLLSTERQSQNRAVEVWIVQP